jgi:hypothetical protein
VIRRWIRTVEKGGHPAARASCRPRCLLAATQNAQTVATAAPGFSARFRLEVRSFQGVVRGHVLLVIHHHRSLEEALAYLKVIGRHTPWRTPFSTAQSITPPHRPQRERRCEVSSEVHRMNELMLDFYHGPLTPEKATIKFKKTSRRLRRWDYPVIGSPVTYNGRDPYYRMEPIRRWIPEQERPAGRPEPACRRAGRPRRGG